MAANPMEPPTQLGNYDLLEKIAEGGMGAVYKGRHRLTGEIVAIKIITANTSKNPVLLQRFEREFQAAKILEHPNIVRGIDYCGTGPIPYLVMEYVDGESIGQRVERDGAMDEAEALQLISQVADGLQRAHKQGLVHRDVKPDNILITRDGVAKLTDLGLVKDTDDNLNLTKTGRGLGTPHYMAPEQFRDAKKVDARGDIYSLGATLFTMLTGEVPFSKSSPLDCWMKKIRNEFPSPKSLNPAISDRVDWAIRRAMSADPEKRPASCREFLEDLTGQGRGSGPQTQPPGHSADLWYMVYVDDLGQKHTVKGPTEGIRRALREGLLGDASNILVSRTKTGQFQPLSNLVEFRDLVLSPAPAPITSRRSSPDMAPPARRTPTPISKASGVIPNTGKPPSEATESPTRPRTPTSQPYVIGARSAAKSDPQAETQTHVKTPYELSPPKKERSTAKAPSNHSHRSYDWTPILLVVIAFLSSLVAYMLLMR